MKKQRGFSLLELLIVLAISSTFLFALYQLFFYQGQQFHHQQTLLVAQENMRLSVHLLKQFLQGAGGAGCQAVPLTVRDHVKYWPIETKIQNGYSVYGFYGHENGWTPALPEKLMNKVAPQSDVIIIEKAGYKRAHLAKPMLHPQDVIYTTQKKLFTAGDIVLIADCQHADLFVISEVYESAQGQVLHYHASEALSHSYGIDAQVMHWQVEAYYVAPSYDATQLALYQKILLPDKPAVELVAGLSTFKMQYAMLFQGNAQFLTADLVNNWSQVRGIVLAIAAGKLSSQLNIILYNNVG